MRQDPEIIMVGEIRDEETAEIAINAGMTGHLVISTLHANTTSGTFARLINMDIEPFLLASTIIGVLGVRLLRTNCMHCAGPYTPEPARSSNSVNSKVMSTYRLCLINRAFIVAQAVQPVAIPGSADEHPSTSCLSPPSRCAKP